MKYFRLIIIAVAIINSLQIINAQTLNKVFTNEEYKYSIVFPENWIIESRKEIIYHVISCQTPDTSKVKQGSIRIMIQDTGGEDNIELIAEKMTNPIKKFFGKDFVENKKGNITINGIDFFLYDYSYNYKNADLPERQRNFNCYYINNGKLFSVMFWGNESFFEMNIEMIMKSIDSFKFLQ
jgi:hypothetical protein